MIYKKHDSVFNYHNASGAKDEKAMYDLIMNDIADTIVHHRQLFVDGLTNVGIPVTRDMSNPDLIKAFSAGVRQNPDLAHNMAKLIMYKNTKGTGPAIPEGMKSIPAGQSNFTGKPSKDGYGGLAFYGQHHNMYGGLGAKGANSNFVNFNSGQRGFSADIHNTGYLGADGVATAGAVGSVSELANSIIGLFGTKKKAAAEQQATEQKLIDLATAKVNAASATVGAHKMAFVLGSIMVVGIVAVIIFKMKK